MGRAEENKRDKRERILRAARELFARYGYAGTTMDDVAERARVSKGALYFHVGSKAALLNRVFHSDFTSWIDEAFDRHEGDPEADLIDRLVTVYSRLLRLMCDAPDLTRVYMTAAGAGDDQDRARQAMSHLLERTAALLDQAKGNDELAVEVDSHQLAYNLWALYFVEQHRWLLQLPTLGHGDHTEEISERLRPRFAMQLGAYLSDRRGTSGPRSR